MKTYVTPAFRVRLIDHFPVLSTKPAYLRLLYYLLTGGQRDQETGLPVVSATVLAELADTTVQNAARNFKAGEFLDAFKRDVLPELEYTGWSKKDRRARVVTHLGIDDGVFELFNDMQEVLAYAEDLDVVDLANGRKRTRGAIASDIASDVDAIRRAVAGYEVSGESSDVIEYHKALPSASFTTAVNDHLAGALDASRALPSPEAMRHTLANIVQIRLHPKPLLKPVEKSARPFSLRPSLLTVKSDIRRVFTQQWVDYDLTSAQLAIVAKEWDVPELRDFLATGTSIWTHLTEELGVSVALKAAFKTAIYSLVFGGGLGNLKAELDEDTGISGLGEKFLAVPLIVSVKDAREARRDAIMEARGGSTALGKVIGIPWGTWPERAEVARSILAQQAQAMELLLIHPVYELARTTTQFSIMLYQFDGITVKFRDKRNCGKWHRDIVVSVAEAASRLGIVTRFEHEPGASFSWQLD